MKTGLMQQIKLLIDEYSANKEKFLLPMYSNKQVSEVISNKLKLKGIIHYTEVQMQRKIEKFKENSDECKKTTGNYNVTQKWLEMFHNISFEDPNFQPVYTLSSSKSLKELPKEKWKPQKKLMNTTLKVPPPKR